MIKMLPHIESCAFLFNRLHLMTTRRRLLGLFVSIAVVSPAVISATTSDPISRFFFGGSSSCISDLRANREAFVPKKFILTAIEPPAASAAVARRGHSATVLSDGKVLIVGGENQNGFVTEAEIFGPSAGNFSFSGNLNIPRADHSATRLSDGRVLIAGGRGDLGSLNSTEIFDPTTGVFTAGPDLTHSRLGPSATLQSDGRVLLAGGDGAGTLETYNPDSNSFSLAGASLNSPRSFHSAALMLDGRILFVGGRDADGNSLSSGEVFDPATGSVSAVDSQLTAARVRPHLRVLFDGKVQVIGGSDDGSLEVYDPQINAFGAYAQVAPEGDTCAGLPAQVQGSQTRAALFHNGQSDETFDRSSHTMSELGTQATVVGGANSSGTALSSALLFNSSNAEISTDKLDYAPRQTVYITGRGFEPGETVRIRVHEDPHTPLERGMDVIADADGDFVGEYVVQSYDLNMRFLVGARGLTSGRTAQTAFTDNVPPTISLTALGTSACQDFNTLASSGTSSTTPDGWGFVEAGTNANTTYTAGTGSGTTGDTYSFGSTGNGERAFGELTSGTSNPTLGASFTNNTGQTITSLAISYTGEQWRLGATSRVDRLDFQYSLNATSLTAGTWTDVNDLDFTAPTTSPTGALDGNSAANRTALSFTITGLNIPNGADFWIRWTSIDASSSDDGLAVDDFCLTPQGEPDVSVAVSPSAVDEDGDTNLVYTFTRSSTSGGALTVNFSVGGDAAFSGDYTQTGADSFTSSAGTVTFAAGDSNATVTIDSTADGTVEPDETVILTVTSGAGYNVGSPASDTGTITNDDHTLSINSTATLTEGDSGQSNMTFTVTLSPAHTETVIVNYSTANGTTNPALGGGACGETTDYVSQSGALTFDPGETVMTIDVPVCGDTRDEPDETFTVTLDTPTNATIAAVQGTSTGTITDDDPMPTISITDVTQAEGDSGTTAFNFTVSLSNPSQATITVEYMTANDTATEPSDYTAASGTVTFVPDDTQETITILVNGDTEFEPSETFFVNLSGNSTNSILPLGVKGTATITNDDTQPTVQFATASSSGAESASPVDLQVTLSNASYQTVTVNYSINVASTATGGGEDYTLASGMLTFDPGDTAKDISISVNNDTLDEVDETVIVDLSSPSNASLGSPSQHTYTIQDNDDPPTMQFALASSSGDESNNANLEVTLSVASSKTVTVSYSVTGGTATGGGEDYTLAASMLTFDPGDTSKNISIVVNDDNLDENDETVIVDLSSPSNASLGSPSQHTYTIQDNDAAPSFSINDVTLAEGNAGTTDFTFTITKTGATALTSTVDYMAADGTGNPATGAAACAAGVDYESLMGALTFNPADTMMTVTIKVCGDSSTEANEIFFVNLPGATNATISDNQGLGAINNDDGVAYTFQGFFAPIDNPPLVNTVKAGAAVAVKWRITSGGAPVSDPSSFVGLFSYPVACGTTDGLETPVETTAPGDSSLKYLGDGNWQINWKTLGSYPKGSCRAMELRLNDGTSHFANFKFK